MKKTSEYKLSFIISPSTLTGSENTRTYVENTYDAEGRVTSQVNNGDTGNETTFTYKTDEDGNTTVTMKNADGTTETGVDL